MRHSGEKYPVEYHNQLYDFFIKQYPAYCWSTLRECPYNLWCFNNAEWVFKHFQAWQTFGRVNPGSGLTCAQEFAGQVRDKELASMIAKTSAMSLQLLRVEKRTRTGFTGRFVYQNRECDILSVGNYTGGHVMSGLIYPWGPAGTYQLTGISNAFPAPLLKKSHLDTLFRSVEIRPGDTTYDTLLQYDAGNVHAIHNYLHPESDVYLHRQVAREISQALSKNTDVSVFTLPGHARRALPHGS